MQRLFNFAFIGIVGLSLLAQTIAFGLKISGAGSVFWSGLYEALAMAIVPATIFAILKCLLYVIRSIRGEGGMALAGSYALVALWPVVLGGIVAANAVDAMTVPGEGGNWRELRVPQEPANESYLDGQAWGAAHKPKKRTECRGNSEFVRGCGDWIRKERDAQAAAGRDWAQKNRPERASQCSGTPDFIRGCRTWYYQNPDPARREGSGPFGTRTTDECIAEVNANYEVMRDLDLLDGNDRAADVVRSRRWEPDLKACERLDAGR